MDQIAGEIDDIAQIVLIVESCARVRNHGIDFSGTEADRPTDPRMQMHVGIEWDRAHAVVDVGFDEPQRASVGCASDAQRGMRSG
ncbi:MAG: hypothetical protein ABI082_09970 [Dokdonella sp.]